MFTVKDLARQAVYAGLYFVFTMICFPVAYNNIQFRLSEVLMILVLFDKKSVIGLTVGCFLANLINVGSMPFDLLFGTLGTLIGLLLMLPLRKKSPWISLVPVVLTNSFLVPISLVLAFPTSDFVSGNPYFFYVLTVFIGEFVMAYLAGNLVYHLLKNNKGFKELINSDQESI